MLKLPFTEELMAQSGLTHADVHTYLSCVQSVHAHDEIVGQLPENEEGQNILFLFAQFMKKHHLYSNAAGRALSDSTRPDTRYREEAFPILKEACALINRFFEAIRTLFQIDSTISFALRRTEEENQFAIIAVPWNTFPFL